MLRVYHRKRDKTVFSGMTFQSLTVLQRNGIATTFEGVLIICGRCAYVAIAIHLVVIESIQKRIYGRSIVHRQMVDAIGLDASTFGIGAGTLILSIVDYPLWMLGKYVVDSLPDVCLRDSNQCATTQNC